MMGSLGQLRKQLLCHILDERSQSPQDQLFCVHPVTSDLDDGWRNVSLQDLAAAVNHLSWWIEKNIGRSPSRSEALAYMGINDIRYTVFILACMKTGYVAFLPSPRNSEAAFMHLLKDTKCSRFVYSPERLKTVKDLQNINGSIKAWEIPGLWEIFDQPAEEYPYDKQFADWVNDPSVIVHSSGTTGFPKPIYITHGYWNAMDNLFLLPVPPGRRAGGLISAAPGRKFFGMAPFFHQMGNYLPLISICHSIPFVLTPPEKPLTVELLARILDETSPNAGLLLPSLIEDLSDSEKGRATLERFEKIFFGGAPLAKDAGDRLSNLEIAIGSTEIGVIPGLVIEDDPSHADWQYFEWNPYYGIEMVQVGSDGKHEMILHREQKAGAIKNVNDRDIHCIFHTFPHLDEYRTNDMFVPHPTKPNLWRYYGRVDDVIVLSNGEKFNPIEMEKVIDSHPLISRSLIVGNSRFHTAALVEPNWQSLNASHLDRNAFIEEIWPYVERANEIAPAYGRLMKSKIAIASKEKPFKCTPKGSTRRGVVMSEYTEEINLLYSQDEEEDAYSFSKGATLDDITKTVKSILSDLFSTDDTPEDSDIFSLGIDSLQTLRLSKVLLKALRAVVQDINPNVLSSQNIYSHPTVTELSRYIHSVLQGNPTKDQSGSQDESELERRKRVAVLVQKYTAGLPSDKINPITQRNAKQVVILTGSTGSLGNYVLNELINDSQVSQIFCLNRSADSETRQVASFKEKGLSAEFSNRVTFLEADLGKQWFGLTAEMYEKLKQITTLIIHNAWKVNFNHKVETFEDTHIKGVRQLVDFSFDSPNHPHLHFISSVGTIGRPGPSAPAEIPFEEPDTVIRQGYSESKFVSERICALASELSGVPTTIHRVGQIAGPTAERGLWNKQEWLPSLVATSKTLGKVPTGLGSMTVDWIPVDSLARIIVEITRSRQSTESDIRCAAFHQINPSRTSWEHLYPVIQSKYQTEPVSLTHWVKELDNYDNPTEEDLQNKPALKILDFYRGLDQEGYGSLAFPAETKRAQAASETMQNLEPINPALMENWLRQWNF